MVKIIYPISSEHFTMVRDLMHGFREWSVDRYGADASSYFDSEAFVSEMNSLPGPFVRPRGNLLLALMDTQAVGCGGVRMVDSDTCEMTRMFVAPQFQQRGIGRAIATQLIAQAFEAGYKTIRLDTGGLQTEAQALYRSLGFLEIPVPKEMEGMLVSMVMSRRRTG